MDLKSISPTFSQFDTFGDLVSVIVRNAFVLAGVVSFLLLVFGGFSVIMGAGAGDIKQLEKGKQTITGAVVGLIVIVTSYWIVQIIETVTGMKLISQ